MLLYVGLAVGFGMIWRPNAMYRSLIGKLIHTQAAARGGFLGFGLSPEQQHQRAKDRQSVSLPLDNSSPNMGSTTGEATCYILLSAVNYS